VLSAPRREFSVAEKRTEVVNPIAGLTSNIDAFASTLQQEVTTFEIFQAEDPFNLAAQSSLFQQILPPIQDGLNDLVVGVSGLSPLSGTPSLSDLYDLLKSTTNLAVYLYQFGKIVDHINFILGIATFLSLENQLAPLGNSLSDFLTAVQNFVSGTGASGGTSSIASNGTASSGGAAPTGGTSPPSAASGGIIGQVLSQIVSTLTNAISGLLSSLSGASNQ